MPSGPDPVEAVDHGAGTVHPLLPGQLALHRACPRAGTSLWMSYRVTGALDVPAFVGAVRSTVARHAALRIGVTTRDGTPVQWVRAMPDDRRLVTLARVTANGTEQFERYARAVLAADIRHAFDLETEYPFVIRLLRFSPVLHAAIGVFSGFAVDATARMTVVRDIWDAYLGHAAGTGPDGAGYLAAVAGRAAATTDRSRAVSAYWRRRAPWLPPRCQFAPGLGGTAAATTRTELLLVVGDEWQALRGRWRASGFTSVQQLLAAFAASVFAVTPQDRIAVSMRLDGRRPAERGVVGMFEVTVPVVLDRPARPAGMLAGVRRELLSAISRRDVPPDALDDMWAASARRLGRPVHHTLLMTYLEDTADHHPPGDSAVTVERGAYTPAFDRTADGLRIAVNERPDGLRVRLTVDGESMSRAAFTGFVAAFRARLHGADAGEPAPVTRGGPPLTPLRAPDGAVLLAVDLAAVSATLATHPAVAKAGAFVEVAEDGGSRLAAEVTTVAEVTAEDLADHVRTAVARRPFLAVPGRITVVPGAARAERSESLLRDGVG